MERLSFEQFAALNGASAQGFGDAGNHRRGERHSAGRVQWASGRSVGRVTLDYMMRNGIVRELDTDLFGDPTRGQTIGLVN